MKIQELANKTNITAYAIRFYEKEGLLKDQHVTRTNNNYRDYTEAAIERLELIKKFQSIDCSLVEIKDILHDRDEGTRTNDEIIEWLESKMKEVEQKKTAYEKMLITLEGMISYRKAIEKPPNHKI